MMLTKLLIGSAVVLAGAALWLYSPDKSQIALDEAYHVAPTDYLQVAGLRLHLRDTGPRAAPVIVLLHGFGSSLFTWDDWAEQLSGSYRVIRFDLPGFGLTGPDPTGDYSDARSVAVLTAVLDQFGIDKAAVIGNSLGGKVAWMFAAEHPDRVTKLVLISPDGFASPGFEYGKRPEVPGFLSIMRYVLPSFLVRLNLAPAFGDSSHLTKALVARYRDMMLAPGVRGAMLDRMRQVMLEDPRTALARIKAPTLLVWGEKDGMIPFINAADYLASIPGSKLVRLPSIGHVPQEEAGNESLAPIRTFLDD